LRAVTSGPLRAVVADRLTFNATLVETGTEPCRLGRTKAASATKSQMIAGCQG
jgi:hypothetical protein